MSYWQNALYQHLCQNAINVTHEYHIRVIPASRSSWGDDDILMSSSPVQDRLDTAPWVVHIIEVAPVVTRLTDGRVVRLQAHIILYYTGYSVILSFTISRIINVLFLHCVLCRWYILENKSYNDVVNVFSGLKSHNFLSHLFERPLI